MFFKKQKNHMSKFWKTIAGSTGVNPFITRSLNPAKSSHYFLSSFSNCKISNQIIYISIFNDKPHVSKPTPQILYSTGQNNIFCKSHESIYRKQRNNCTFLKKLMRKFWKTLPESRMTYRVTNQSRQFTSLLSS